LLSEESVLEDSLLSGDLDDPPPRGLCKGTDQNDLHVAVTVDGTRVSRSRFGDPATAFGDRITAGDRDRSATRPPSGCLPIRLYGFPRGTEPDVCCPDSAMAWDTGAGQEAIERASNSVMAGGGW
jgi:hypothetical protein